MSILIKQIKKGDKKAELFRRKEWEKFNKENKYIWREKTYIFIAIDGKRIIGYIRFIINGSASYLDQLIVKKEDRGKGIGDKLINKFENISKKYKCHVMYIKTSNIHKEAIELYKKNNYKISARLNNFEYHFNWYIMEKRLK